MIGNNFWNFVFCTVASEPILAVNQFYYCFDQSAGFCGVHHKNQQLTGDELQDCQLLKNVAISLSLIVPRRSCCHPAKNGTINWILQIGVGPRVSSRPNGTSTLENRGQEEEEKDVQSIRFKKPYIYIGEQKMYRVFGIGSRPIQFPHAK